MQNGSPNGPNPTREDVARRAGVSTATVSYVLNDGPRSVSLATRAAVLRAVEEVGYRPNHPARQLARRQARVLAFVTPDNTNPFFAELGQHVETAVTEAGYTLVIGNTGMDPSRERALLALLRERHVDGLVIVTAGLDWQSMQPALGERLPAVLLNRQVLGAALDMVLVDNVDIGRQATDHLLDHGHTRVVCLAGPSNLVGAAQRVRGYREALVLRGCAADPELVVEADFTFEGGYTAMRKYLDYHPAPEAVFACNDQMAVGVLRAAHEVGLNVPRDLAVVGADGTFIASVALPPLTTVAQPTAESGRLAATMLLDRLRGSVPSSPRHVTMKSHLVLRESCGCQPGAPSLDGAQRLVTQVV